MTLIYEFDLDILKVYLCTKNEVRSSMHSKVRAQTDRYTDKHTHTHTHTDATENITFPLSRLVINRKLYWDSRLELIVFKIQTVNQALR